jgi:flagellar FliL protein
MADKKDSSEQKSEGKKLPVALILQVAFALTNIGVMGLGGYWVYAATIGWHSPEINEDTVAAERKLSEAKQDAQGSEAGPLVYTMDKFTVNLAGEPKRTIRLEVNLEMLGKEGFEEIVDTDNRAKARDRIVRILNDNTFNELETIQGKLFLKDRIATDINALLDKGIVKDVYFSEFVVQ